MTSPEESGAISGKETGGNVEQQNMPFKVKDCSLIVRMAGVPTAMNLRELQERVSVIPIECLFHHFCETVIRASFDDPEFHNDFAVWAGRQLRDRVLAERLAIINPYKFPSFEELRLHVLDIIEERLSEVYPIPWALPGREFQFMQAVTVVFDTGVELTEPKDLIAQLPKMSQETLYYHFVEARRRTENREDDFSAWLATFGDSAKPIIDALKSVDFYFMTLRDLRTRLVGVVGKTIREPKYA